MPHPIAAGSLTERIWSHCCWPRCQAPTTDGSDDMPLCELHYHLIGRQFFRNRTIFAPAFDPEYQRDRRERADRERVGRRREREAARAGRACVYYVRIADHVKIGTTVNLRERISSFYVGEQALLATEPGGRERERQRHEEFAAERIHPRRELFNPSRRLLAHIEAVVAEHGPPNVTGYVHVE